MYKVEYEYSNHHNSFLLGYFSTLDISKSYVRDYVKKMEKETLEYHIEHGVVLKHPYEQAYSCTVYCNIVNCAVAFPPYSFVKRYVNKYTGEYYEVWTTSMDVCATFVFTKIEIIE